MNDNFALRRIIKMVVADRHSSEVYEIADGLPDHSEEAAAAFCDRFELGNWFYEAVTLKEIDVKQWLLDIAKKMRLEEAEAEACAVDAEQTYRSQQGWQH